MIPNLKIRMTVLFSALFISVLACSRTEMDLPESAPESRYLVIQGNCGSVTKTDIVEGKSSWDKGDRITVVYDGVAYSYEAQESGAQTYFTSRAGIVGYDATKTITAYYPETDASGIVRIESKRKIEFKTGTQTNSACAPLVGKAKSDNFSDGTLKMDFSNIFSVIELRIDGGGLASAPKSLHIEPADKDAFEGYLTFIGTVDPETLALTPSDRGTGISMELDFPEGTDLTEPQTIKFPVGRISSPSGLALTLTTNDGKEYTRTIYKTGIKTWEESGGVYTSIHLAKAMYAFAPAGGISTADDFLSFARAYNAGESISEWMNSEGKVILKDNVDMAGVTDWSPIGQATYTWASNVLTITSGRPFDGWFDGCGHTVSNLKLVCGNETANSSWGLFGALAPGAIVENIVFDSSCSFEANPSVATDCGLVAGMIDDATVRNIRSAAPMSYNGVSGNSRSTMALVGFAFANHGACIENLENSGAITAGSGENTTNGGTCVHIAGICGFGTNDIASTERVQILNCVNTGDLTSGTARTSGIVAAANRYTLIKNCLNTGNNINEFATAGNARIGNITCVTGVGAAMEQTVNKGDVICKTGGAAGGIVCLVNHDNNCFIGCESYGRVITDRANNSYKGTFFGQCNKNAIFQDCVCQGDVGMYNNGAYQMAGVDQTDYFDYIGAHSAAATYVTSTNIRWDNAGAVEKVSFPAKWVMAANTSGLYGNSWTGSGILPATSGSLAYMTAVRSDTGLGAGKPFTYSVSSNRPLVSSLVEGDYLLFSIPVKDFPAGSAVDFNATISGDVGAPKYYIVEYLDGGEWKSADSELRVASEDASVKYSYKCSGLSSGSSYQHTTVMRTVRFENAIPDGEVKIRCRAVGSMTCGGSAQSPSSSDGSTGILTFGFTGAYIQNLGTAEPLDTKRVLCIGNSFSYYHNPVFYLREIAWTQGHHLETRAHLKGSQTFGQHLSLDMTLDAISEGGYDFVFLQDQSQAAARYSQDNATYSYVKSDCLSLRDKVKADSPSCKVVLENTWSYPGSSFGGFTDYESFYSYLADGNKSIAADGGMWISPIGQAFRTVYNGSSGINLYYSDNKHQSEYGAYLKACVNYLVMFGTPFTSDVPDCGLPADKAAYLRSVAEETVLGHEQDYLIER